MVLDTSVVIDFLLGIGEAPRVARCLEDGAAAPDVLVFESLAVLRRMAGRGDATGRRLSGAVDDLGDLPIELFPTLPLRTRAWELRENLTVGDALFVSLAEHLEEPLLTKDGRLARAAERLGTLSVVHVG